MFITVHASFVLSRALARGLSECEYTEHDRPFLCHVMLQGVDSVTSLNRNFEPNLGLILS